MRQAMRHHMAMAAFVAAAFGCGGDAGPSPRPGTAAPGARGQHASTTSTSSTSVSTGGHAGTGGEAGGGMGAGGSGGAPSGLPKIFLILMENHNWSQIINSSSAPYI